MPEKDALRRTADSMLPFLMGIVIGVLTSYATIAGKLSSLDERSLSQGVAISDLRTQQARDMESLRADLKDLRGKIR